MSRMSLAWRAGVATKVTGLLLTLTSPTAVAVERRDEILPRGCGSHYLASFLPGRPG